MENKNLLSNIAIIRPILILLLVFYHAFAVYSGAWGPIENYPDIRLYWWLDKLSYAFMLETFVFVSGYVFGYQVRVKGVCKLEAKNLFWTKFKRLIIPCAFFSFLYILLFYDITQPLYKTVYDVLNGVGHMWFLPMLFWCFGGIWLIEKIRIKSIFMIPLLVVLSIFSFIPLPFQMNATMYYMLFFYVGYIIQKENYSISRFNSLKYCLITTIVFIVLFPTLTLLKENVVLVNDVSAVSGGGYFADSQIIIKALGISFRNLIKLTYSITGVVMLFLVVGTFLKTHTGALPQWLVNIGGLCMGVYLFQQFILKALYYDSTFPMAVSPYLLPWYGFIISLVSSLILAFFCRKTKIGIFLIG